MCTPTLPSPSSRKSSIIVIDTSGSKVSLSFEKLHRRTIDAAKTGFIRSTRNNVRRIEQFNYQLRPVARSNLRGTVSILWTRSFPLSRIFMKFRFSFTRRFVIKQESYHFIFYVIILCTMYYFIFYILCNYFTYNILFYIVYFM